MLSDPFSCAHKIITVLFSGMLRLETGSEYPAGKMGEIGGKKLKHNAYRYT